MYSVCLAVLLAVASAVRIDKAGSGPVKKSSLFEAYAVNPYGYAPQYYVPQPQQMIPQQQQMAYYGMPQQPYYYPQQQQYPMQPYQYQPQPMGRPNPGYYYPQPQQQPHYVENVPLQPAPPATGILADQVQVKSVPTAAVAPVAKARVQVAPAETVKSDLAKALEEASRQIDKANANTVDFASYENINFQPIPPTKAPMSFSEETVPIDNHILNWRELVGLPANNPVVHNDAAIMDATTPMLSGSWSR